MVAVIAYLAFTDDDVRARKNMKFYKIAFSWPIRRVDCLPFALAPQRHQLNKRAEGLLHVKH